MSSYVAFNIHAITTVSGVLLLATDLGCLFLALALLMQGSWQLLAYGVVPTGAGWSVIQAGIAIVAALHGREVPHTMPC